MESRIGLKVHHKPLFTPFLGSVRLEDAAMDVKDYLTIKSGTARIRYSLNMFQRSYPVSIQAENLAVEPGIELKKTLGNQLVVFDTISIRLIFLPHKKMLIEYLDAESKTIQFHLGAKDLNGS